MHRRPRVDGEPAADGRALPVDDPGAGTRDEIAPSRREIEAEAAKAEAAAEAAAEKRPQAERERHAPGQRDGAGPEEMSHAEDEDAPGRREALQEDRHGEARAREAGPAPLHAEAVAQAEPAAARQGRARRAATRRRSSSWFRTCERPPRPAARPRPTDGSSNHASSETRRRRSSKRHKRILKEAEGYWGARSRLIKTARDAVEKGWKYAYRDRKQRKREFRRSGSPASTRRRASTGSRTAG